MTRLDRVVLVTGANGFVGGHMVQHLASLGISVVGVGRKPSMDHVCEGCDYRQCDLLDSHQVRRLVMDVLPSHVIHLAGSGNVRVSWEHPADCLENNVLATLNLLDGLRLQAKGFRGVLVVTSNHGESVVTNVDSVMSQTPSTPYGWSKRIQTDVCRMYSQCYQIPLTIACTFNLAGPGNSEGVCSQLSKAVASIERGTSPPHLPVGNIAVERDFLDVRDAVRAYWMLLEQLPAHSGETFSVCSGISISIDQVIKALRKFAQKNFHVDVQSGLMRPDDPRTIRGNPTQLMTVTGWSPKFAIETTLLDTLNYFRIQPK